MLAKKKKMLSKIEISVRDSCKHISTSEIGNFKITGEANLFRKGSHRKSA